MIQEDARFDYPRCERQVLFNSRLERIATINKRYIDPVAFLDSLPRLPILDEKIKDYVPFLEVVIIKNSPESFSYKFTVTADSDLESSTWKLIRSFVDSVLRKFEEDIGAKDLFYPKEADELRSEEIREKWQTAHEVKNRYKELEAEFRKLKKAGAEPSILAGKYQLDEKDVKFLLYECENQRAQPAEVAVLALMTEMHRKGWDKKLGIFDAERLKDDILNRKLPFPKRKPYILQRRPVVLDRDQA